MNNPLTTTHLLFFVIQCDGFSQCLQVCLYFEADCTLVMIGSILAHSAAPGLILGIPKDFSLDVAEIYRRECLEQLSKA